MCSSLPFLRSKKTPKWEILHEGKVVWVRISQTYLATWVVHVNTAHILGHARLGSPPMHLTFLMSMTQSGVGAEEKEAGKKHLHYASKSMSQ